VLRHEVDSTSSTPSTTPARGAGAGTRTGESTERGTGTGAAAGEGVGDGTTTTLKHRLTPVSTMTTMRRSPSAQDLNGRRAGFRGQGLAPAPDHAPGLAGPDPVCSRDKIAERSYSPTMSRAYGTATPTATAPPRQWAVPKATWKSAKLATRVCETGTLGGQSRTACWRRTAPRNCFHPRQRPAHAWRRWIRSQQRKGRRGASAVCASLVMTAAPTTTFRIPSGAAIGRDGQATGPASNMRRPSTDRVTRPSASTFSIRGAASRRSDDQGFLIKGAASARELFPEKLSGSNAGKELFSDKLDRRPRQRAEDLFY